MKSQAQLSQHILLAKTSLPDPKYSKRVCLGTSPCIRVYGTAFGVNYNRGSASGRGPIGRPTAILETQENDRDRDTLITVNSLRVTRFWSVDSRQNPDANQSNQSYV